MEGSFGIRLEVRDYPVDHGECVLSSRDEQNGHQFMSSLPARAGQPF